MPYMTDQGPLGRPPRGASVPGGAPCGAGPQLIRAVAPAARLARPDRPVHHDSSLIPRCHLASDLDLANFCTSKKARPEFWGEGAEGLRSATLGVASVALPGRGPLAPVHPPEFTVNLAVGTRARPFCGAQSSTLRSKWGHSLPGPFPGGWGWEQLLRRCPRAKDQASYNTLTFIQNQAYIRCLRAIRKQTQEARALLKTR
jgi:hypothetical protein